MKPYALYLFILSSLLFGMTAVAQERASDVIRIEQPFARATVPGMAMSGAFMQIHNDGKQEHLLVRASSDVAKHVELHNHVMEDGMMRMRQMAHFHLKPGKARVLKPGGLHIMLMGLKQAMPEGSNITIELYFDDDSHMQVSVPVKSISAHH